MKTTTPIRFAGSELAESRHVCAFFNSDEEAYRVLLPFSNVEPPSEHAAEEIKSLQRCISDLITVLALPAMWTGGESSFIVSTLVDSIISMLHLDFAYARLRDAAGDESIEMLRVTPSRELSGGVQGLRELLRGLLRSDPHNWPAAVRDPAGDGAIYVMPLSLGLQDEVGLIVAGSRRVDFPRRTERLLLSVAANQAAIGLQEARLLDEQKRAAAALDQRVAQRTRELAAAIDELELRVSMLQFIPVAAWSVRPDGSPDIVNQGWFEYTGQTSEEVNSNPEAWMATLHPEDRQRVARSYWEGIRSGRGFTMEARFLRAQDRTYRWHLNRAVAIRDAAGNILRFVGTSTDIDDLKQAQEELRNTQAALAHLTRVMTMGELTASIAHEINQPLSGIITNASTCLRMLAADPPNLDGARATAQRTLRDSNRATEVIQRLRTLFTHKQPKTEPVDLNEAAREVLTLSLSELRGSRVVLQTEFDEGLPAVNGDRVQLQQVILNLTLNAAEAMREVEDRQRDLLVATAREDANHVRLSVRDCGVGIHPEAFKKLFDAFYTTKSHGMGIGLSISRSIIESHSGRLWASANDGPGATFSFSLPCRSDTTAAEQV